MAFQRSLFLFAVFFGSSEGFTAPQPLLRSRLVATHAEAEHTSSLTTTGRRAWVGALVTAAAAGVATPAFAGPPVGEGGLPDGARHFSAVLAAQRDWHAIAKRLQEGGSDVSDKEWQNISLFLRKLYGASDDMAAMAKGLSGSSQQSATKLVKDFRAAVKAADPDINKKDAAGTLKAYNETIKMLNDFLELFNDVPDEL